MELGISGDACHPMLPYLAQGANSSLEDGAVLGRLLGYVRSRDQIGAAVDTYQQLRKARGEAIARETLGQVSALQGLLGGQRCVNDWLTHQRDSFHLPDGALQEARDAIFAAGLDQQLPTPFPSRW